MFWRHYVYLHRKANTGEVFYVGKGTVRKRKKSPDNERAYCMTSRSKWWHQTVFKHGLIVEVVAMFVNDIDSQEFEKQLILEYGRRNLKAGTLVNLTDGGDGHAGFLISDERRKQMSEYAKGQRSVAWVKAIRVARKNGGNGGVVKKGDKLPTAWRKNISNGQKGPNNYMRGRTGKAAPNRREVINEETGEKYPTTLIAAEAFGLNMKTLYNMLSGHRPNKTKLRFA